MRSRASSAVALAAFAFSCVHSTATTPAPTQAQSAEPLTQLSFVVTNAHVYGAGDDDAMAIRGTKIVALGKGAELSANCTAPCLIVDAKDGFLAPGFHDAHAHVASAGEASFELTVRGASIPNIQSALKTAAANHPHEAWILGRGWSYPRFKQLPTRLDLDAAEPTRPVALRDHSGHNLWTNSAAIAAAGITKATKDPFGGKIVRDADGEPTGMFIDAAQGLVTSKQPAQSDEDRDKYILAGQKATLAAGITSMEGGPVTYEQATAYARLDREGRLEQRAFLWAPLLCTDAAFEKWIAFAHALPRDGKVQIVAFKGFADGTFAASTAAMLEPYTDDTSNRGRLYIEQSLLDRAVVRANRAGFPAAIHAIGDHATRSALDAFEFAKNALSKTPMNRVEHASFVDPEDAKRFGPLGVAASVQPIWLYGYPTQASLGMEGRVGASRVTRLYPWNDLAKGGALLLFGSDVPSSDLFDPVTGIFSAAQRQVRDGTTFSPEQRIDADLALRAYTMNPAVAIGWGDRIGKIAVGYEADLVLLDHDPRNGAQSLAEDPLRRVWVAGHLQ